MWKAVLLCALSVEVSGFGLPAAARPARSAVAAAVQRPSFALRAPCAPRLMEVDDKAGADKKEEEEGWTIDKVAALGLAGVLSIAVAESVFWVLSFPISAIVYYVATGGVIAQYRTVLTAAAMTPWMDRNVVQPYLTPLIEKYKGGD